MVRYIRWAISVAIVQGAALLVMAQVVPGFIMDFGPDVALVALLFTVIQLVSWPVLYMISTRIHPALFPLLSFLLSGALVLIVKDSLNLLNIAQLQIENMQTAIIITLGLTASYTLFGGLFSLRDIDAYDWFVTRRLRRTFAHGRVSEEPGTIFIEIDGLSAPLLEQALADGWMPNLARWQAEGTHLLNEWETDLSSQTSASQAGILLGDNTGIPAFRWYDKPEGRLRVSSSIATARDLEQRLSTGKGLLIDGASRWNVFSGDAPDSLVTYSTLGIRHRRGSISYLALFASPFEIGRTIALYLGDIFRERWQAIRQRYEDVQPRIKRGWKYAVVRAATTTVMQEFAQFVLLADMYRGVPAVYCTFFAYDEVAHHSGINRVDALKVLTRIDTVIGTLQKESKHAGRPYKFVVLSDHGQSMGPTFRQRNDRTIGELVSSLIEPGAKISVYDALVEDEGHIRMTLREALALPNEDRTVRLIQRAMRRLPTTQSEIEVYESPAESASADVIVLASGNLSCISFPQVATRMTYEEIVDRYPALIPGLLNNDDIGFIMLHSADEGTLVLGGGGIRYLNDDAIAGDDPLKHYGENAVRHLRRTDSFANVPDILVMSACDPKTGEVYAFEEQVGSHGGLGGWQSRPFVMHPIEYPFPSKPVVGAGTLHDLMVSWIRPDALPRSEEVLESGDMLQPGSQLLDTGQRAPVRIE